MTNFILLKIINIWGKNSKTEHNLHRILRAIDRNEILTKLNPNDYCREGERMIPLQQLLDMYQNYPRRNFGNYRWAYWGDAFPSLLTVKNKYDPNNLFRFEQSITPHPSDDTARRSRKKSRFTDKTIVREMY